jgi:LacI family transcriptional regulator
MHKVALLVETSRGYGRGLLQGIIKYARLHGPWSFYIHPGDFEQALPEMKRWGGTGIIARIETAKVARAIRATGLPTICLDLSGKQIEPCGANWSPSEVHPDPVASVDLAVSHLIDRGFQRLAFVGVPDRIWSEQRQAAFTARLAREARDCIVYQPPGSNRHREWGREQEVLAQWLRGLPKPIGLVACNDDRGRQVLEAALVAGVQVPDEVAIVGIDNDDVFCELSSPPLSSVALNTERGGFETARLLDGLMSGTVRKPQQILVEPLWVVTRQSTDVLGIDDRDVAVALRFIRQHGDRAFGVKDVLAHVPISRRSLEIRFRRAVGRSIQQEIQRVHLDRAKRLLAETDLATDRIADQSGFSTASYMGQVFQKWLDLTPTQYRTHVRCRSF